MGKHGVSPDERRPVARGCYLRRLRRQVQYGLRLSIREESPSQEQQINPALVDTKSPMEVVLRVF